MGFFPTWILLGISKLLIFTCEFRRLAPLFGISIGVAAWLPLLTPKQECRALQIGRLIKLAARYTPWDSNCFPQAITARLLLELHKIPYTLCFGLMREITSKEIQAHAWVSSGRVNVTGGMSFKHFTIVGCFIGPALAQNKA
jgi:hypothetical protein